ncbi:MAG TPA: circularly permuted type 2 ATP-grasp protein, partial [Calditrichia bacterium]|nr:circularly permuted type 2 ATP-grasp protein [Calditrichia bacterium]
MNFNNYNPEHFFDEMFESSGATRSEVRAIVDRLNALSREEIRQRQTAAELALLNMGITFSVYGDEKGLEKIFPFDIIPRIIPSRDWQVLEAGLRQRIQALNLFIADIYKDQRIIREKIIPREVIESCSAFRRECMNLQPPNGVWCHITGTDIIRAGSGEFMVLEDNLRCPSGVSYVLENRSIMKRVFPQVFESLNVRPVDDYSNRLLETLQILSPREKPTIVVLTPGKYNSAYFEHSFLARQMGVELVEGQDLVVKDDFVFMRTTRGFEQVDVIYRRIDDDFLDPTVFRADS